MTVPLTARGAAQVNQSLALPVGSVPVFITPRGRVTYAVEWVLLVALLAWWVVRKGRVRRQGEPALP